MLRDILSVFRGDPQTGADHFDRNRLQEHMLPDHLPDQDDEDGARCVVDINQTTWIADGSGFDLANEAFGLHPGDVESWRGIPARAEPPEPAADPAPPVSTVGFQAVYEGEDDRLSESSTTDFVSPVHDRSEHFVRDVLPDRLIGDDYNDYPLSSGQDLGWVGPGDIPANLWPCEDGRYVGGRGFEGREIEADDGYGDGCGGGYEGGGDGDAGDGDC